LGKQGNQSQSWSIPIWAKNQTGLDLKALMTISYQRILFECQVCDGDNIDEHLNLLKSYVDRINYIQDDNFTISDARFKGIVISSLLPSWDTFTQQYIGMHAAYNKQDPKKLLTSHEIIGIIKEEYLRHNQQDKNLVFYSQQQNHGDHRSNMTNQANQASLASRILPVDGN
jgi:hypothetical protein